MPETHTNPETGAVVTSFSTFCPCPNDLIEDMGGLRDDHTCPNCGMQWA